MTKKTASMVIRPITPRDFDKYVEFAFSAGLGITSMPKDTALLKKKIEEAEQAFHSEITKPGREHYLFVLEDATTGTIGGTCGIYAATGVNEPTYFYRRESEHHHSARIALDRQLPLLRLIAYENGPSEICSLYLHPSFRKFGVGRLLSLSRLAFIGAHRHRFTDTIIAEMRGIIDDDGKSPFWEAIGRRFVRRPLTDMLDLIAFGRGFIPEVVPRWPIYLDLLPEAASHAVGEVHEHTKPALKMLLDEGFTLTDEVDVFDGGPKVSAPTKALRAITDRRQGTVTAVSDEPTANEPIMLISNGELNFRATTGTVDDSEGVVITSTSATLLGVEAGSTIHYTPLKRHQPGHRQTP